MKTYKTKVTKTNSGKGDSHGRINYLPRDFIGKEVEVREMKIKYLAMCGQDWARRMFILRLNVFLSIIVLLEIYFILR